MIELPEDVVLAKQIGEAVTGKRIKNVTTAKSPHKFAWYCGDPKEYSGLLVGKVIGTAASYGGLVEIRVSDATLLFGDGVNLRYYAAEEARPDKHQLWIEFEDSSSLVGLVRMYGGLWAFPVGSFDNKYYKIPKEEISPFSGAFNGTYFDSLFSEKTNKLSLKAFLATEQRIPGLGNGVLQDILFNAKMHPKRKIDTLSNKAKEELFDSLKLTLTQMVDEGGRDTETDLHGRSGGYKTLLSRNTVNKPCLLCGAVIRKETYMGGSIYFCPTCQKK
jgi:formamidopyrimidine-DNA glycosylase